MPQVLFALDSSFPSYHTSNVVQEMKIIDDKDDFDSTQVDLSKLMKWYSSHCDGEWEHGYGVSLTSLDNPGWLLKVNLAGTNLDGATMDAISEDSDQGPLGDNSSPWIECGVCGNQFVGASDPTQLPRLISTFNALIDSASNPKK